MKVLIDTHVALWWLADDSRLPPVAAEVIADPTNVVVVSAASVWEIAVEKARGRLDAPDDLLEVLTANDVTLLAISAAHALVAGGLPGHHADPFDRMLIAQAVTDQLTLVSVHRRFADYDVDLLPLGL